MIKILLIEDNDKVRQDLVSLLEEATDIEIAGAVADGIEALELLDAGLTPAIIVTDLNMPGIDGLELQDL